VIAQPSAILELLWQVSVSNCTSHYGRPADSGGAPAGTSGEEMINNVSKYWPDLEGERLLSMEGAIGWLRKGAPLIFHI
jgi:hypothetical protein